ncbi:MAG: hypothetical protein GXO83_13710 [Chlorobi bacterium]|nr:hypothetical protein [Chlorobiota bacterium]
MKEKLKYWIILLLLIIQGCITDQEVTTVFSTDGSCLRKVTFKSDEKKFDLSDLNIPVDSTWAVTVRKDTADTSKFFIRAEKHFANVEELNFLYDSLPHNFSGIQRNITWKVKFRWFYTFYDYTETISALFHQRPMSEFMTPEEIRYALAEDDEKDSLFSNLDSTALEELDERVDEKGWKWIAACTFDEVFKGLLKTAGEHPVGVFTVENLEKEKDSLLKRFENVAEDSAFNGYFARTFGIEDFDSLVNTYPDNFKTYKELEDVVGRTFGEEYVNKIQLPGTLVYTNAEKTENGMLAWKIGSMKFLGEDYIMEAVTKKSNPWAFYIAIFVVLLAVMFWIVPLKKKKKPQ